MINAGHLNQGESVEVYIFDHNLNTVAANLTRKIVLPLLNHQCRLSLNGIKKPTYIRVNFPAKTAGKFDLDYFLYRPGTEINFRLGENGWAINSIDSSFYAVQAELKKITVETTSEPRMSPSKFEENFKTEDDAMIEKLHFLQHNKNIFSPDEYELLRSDMIAGLRNDHYSYLASYDSYFSINDLRTRFEKYRQATPVFKEQVSLTADCQNIIPSFYAEYYFKTCVISQHDFDFKAYYSSLLKTFKDDQLEKAIIYLIIKQGHFSGDISAELKSAADIVINKVFKDYIESYISFNADGAQAFNFVLTDTARRKVRLTDFKETTVVIDFWFTGCHACTELAPYMKNLEKEMTDKNVTFVAISIDKSSQTWRQSIKSGAYVGPGVINLITNGNGDKDPVIINYKVSGYPTLVVIDKNGKLYNIKDDPRTDNAQSLKAKILSVL